MNIYEIKCNLLSIFDELEENGGELTEELEEALLVNQDNLKEKIEDYSHVITLLNGDINTIKTEQKRLKDLADRKQKLIDRLKKVIAESIEEFGDTKKSGVKYLDCGTISVSLRSTESVEVNEDALKAISSGITSVMTFNKSTNQLDVINGLAITDVQHACAVGEDVYNITENDLDNTNVELSVKIPVKNLIDGTSYNALKEIAKISDDYTCKAYVSKSDIKPLLKENGACAPNIAKLNVNKSVIIK